MLSLSERDIQQLHDWGFNSVRYWDMLTFHGIYEFSLGVMWPGVEPEQGQYNTTYIEVMQKIVNDLGKAGIYSIIDFHQDVISPFYCGEGTWISISTIITLWLYILLTVLTIFNIIPVIAC